MTRTTILAIFCFALIQWAEASAKPTGWQARSRSVAQSIARPFRMVHSWQRHNRRVDRDERLSLRAFRRYRKTRVLPAQAVPIRVLTRKVGRAESALELLATASGKKRSVALGYSVASTEVFNDGPYSRLNQLCALVQDASSYASRHKLSAPRLRSIACKAVKTASWHIQAEPPAGAGVGNFAVIFQGAKQSYRLLSRVASQP